MGIDRPFNVLQRNSEMESVVDLIAITVVQAQANREISAPSRQMRSIPVVLQAP
jgi:hypothetical protein